MKKFLFAFLFSLALMPVMAEAAPPTKDNIVVETRELQASSLNFDVSKPVIAVAAVVGIGLTVVSKVGNFSVYSAEGMKNLVIQYFQENPDVEEVWTTTAAEFFTTPNYAHLRKDELNRHFKQLKRTEQVEVQKWIRSEMLDTNTTNVSPNSNDADVPPIANAANVSPNGNDVDAPPIANAANVSPNGNDADAPPTANDANVSPNGNDADAPPTANDANVSPEAKGKGKNQTKNMGKKTDTTPNKENTGDGTEQAPNTTT